MSELKLESFCSLQSVFKSVGTRYASFSLTTSLELKTCILLKLIGQKDYPKNGTFFDASLPQIESILFDACM